MDKIRKEVKSELLAFYQGGTKLRAATTHEPAELKARIENARKAMQDAEIDTANEDEAVADDKLYLTRTGLLFYSIIIPVTKKSDIVIAPAGVMGIK